MRETGSACRIRAASRPSHGSRPSTAQQHDPTGSRVDPSEAGFVRGRQPLGQAADPAEGCSGEPCLEDLRIPGGEPTVRGCIDKQPADHNPVWRTVAGGEDGRSLGFGRLAGGGACGGAQVVEPIPDLDDDKGPGCVVAKGDIDRAGRIRWSGH